MLRHLQEEADGGYPERPAAQVVGLNTISTNKHSPITRSRRHKVKKTRTQQISKHGSSQGAGKRKHPHRLTLDTARKISASLHPLAAFLEARDEDDSRLWRLAQQLFKQPFDLDHFRAELLSKLQRVPYSQPQNPDRHKYTFHDRMKAAGALSVFLRTSTLRRIREWLLLADIISLDRDLERKHLSVERYPLRFHSFLTSELSRHERAIIAAISKYKVDRHSLDEYLTAVDREKMRQLRILCLSRWRGSRESLLGDHRNEYLVAEVGIFKLLKRCLANTLSDRFLRRLAVLLCAPPDAMSISEERDEACRKALARSS